jgi:hypothetical protein
MIEFINNLGINSTSGLIGLGLLLIGFFLILAGFGIISIEKITVKQGRATWIVGIIIVLIGGFLFYPELINPKDAPDSAEITEEIPVSTPLSNRDEDRSLSEWRTVKFAIPSDNLWQEEEGAYTAIGSEETIAWSEDTFQGDIEISMDISTSSSYGAANIIVYGNGWSLSTGNLIFTIASDLQAVSANSIYEGGGGEYLFSAMNNINLTNQEHQVLISIIDRKVDFSLDGTKITSIFLDDEINTQGRIGLLKYWEIETITFSNIQVRVLEPAR